MSMLRNLGILLILVSCCTFLLAAEEPCCPPCPDWGVPRTGQTESIYEGDDGDLQVGFSWPKPRFTDHGDGTVTDKLTNLMWTQDVQLILEEKNWHDAIDAWKTLEFALHNDWRLPNVRELLSLIDYGQCEPALPEENPFLNVQSDWFWSSTTRPCGGGAHSMVVSMAHGDSGGSGRAYSHCVWCVRGGL